MSGYSVADVITGRLDAQGAQVLTVYAKVRDVYAVYRTHERVVVQFADDGKLGSEQRQALAPLTAVKGEISGLIDGWRDSPNANTQSKARLFDRRVADALIVALQGDAANACVLMAATKADVLEERTSVGRTQYVIVAAIAAAIMWAITSLLASPLVTGDGWSRPIWQAASVGILGSFFSIAVGVRSRSVLTDLQSRDNIVDALSRIFIGAVSAVVLVCLLRANLVQFGLGGTILSGTTLTAWAIFVIAFAAGFSERLVGDLLSKATLSAVSNNPLGGGSSVPPVRAPSPTANEQNPRGVSSIASSVIVSAKPVAAPDDDLADGCLADGSVNPNETTDDVQLPESSGGVEEKKPARPEGGSHAL